MPFPLKILGCDMHSLPDVIKGFYCFKDCEDNSPIITANPRDELTVYGKLGISPQVCYWRVSSVQFPYKYTLHENFFFSSNQCTSFIPSIVKHSITFAWQHQPFRYNSWHVRNQCLNPNYIKLSLESLISSTTNSLLLYVATYAT